MEKLYEKIVLKIVTLRKKLSQQIFIGLVPGQPIKRFHYCMERRWESCDENAEYEGLILPALLQAARRCIRKTDSVNGVSPGAVQAQRLQSSPLHGSHVLEVLRKWPLFSGREHRSRKAWSDLIRQCQGAIHGPAMAVISTHNYSPSQPHVSNRDASLGSIAPHDACHAKSGRRLAGQVPSGPRSQPPVPGPSGS
ncbi:uncharacterized protein BDW70DRAFT_6260 [Aspergillus foveolatus]|uniref:uncharacterized protein n=1 Tax=Aspergillus foveolatus TaxID=210207 RepID=UPI003CCDF4ED